VRMSLRMLAAVCLLGVVVVRPGVGDDAPAPPFVTVSGEVANPMKLTAEALAKLPRQLVKARDHGGAEAEYEGVPLAEILKQAGAKLGQDNRGPRAGVLPSWSRRLTTTRPCSPSRSSTPLSTIA